MSEQEGQGTSSADSIAQTAGQIGQAAAKAGANAARRATANAAAATVKAGITGGKAVSEIAVGTAAGGPLGAVISAAWSMRHSLFKVLVCICLVFLIIIVSVVSMPSIIVNRLFGLDGSEPVQGATMQSVYEEMASDIAQVVDEAYDRSLAKVEQIISDGGYDYDESMEVLINHAQGSAGYDVCYIISAYSASVGQMDADKEDMIEKLKGVSDRMFPVTDEAKSVERQVPVTYFTYKKVKVTVVTKKEQSQTTRSGKPKYKYETKEKNYFVQDAQMSGTEEITVDAYQSVEVEVPIYNKKGKIKGTKKETYYKKDGTQTLTPAMETVNYVECTIHPFDNAVIAEAFGIDLDAKSDRSGLTYREVIENMAKALKAALYGAAVGGESVNLTDQELIDFVGRQNCSAVRKQLLTTALSLVGKVPYFWGGKSGPGWNEQWNSPKLVTAEGSSSTGTIRPYGLDCSGFTQWVYNTALGVEIGGGTSGQYPKTVAVTKENLQPGDLGFLAKSGGGGWQHVLMFAGYDENGTGMWVHSSSGKGVVLNTPGYAGSLVLRRPSGVDYDAAVGMQTAYGEPLYEIEVDVTHYCNCEKCNGKWAGGKTAGGKMPDVGMVAMSSYYPFGTQIMINGTMYTVEDRGGAGIENDIHRVDIFVHDHQEALRKGRFKTTAKIYRLGR